LINDVFYSEPTVCYASLGDAEKIQVHTMVVAVGSVATGI